MSNLAKLEFVALDISGKNYLSWVLDAEIHLAAKGLSDTIKSENTATSQDKAKAMIFLRHHLHEDLKNEYLTVKDPQILWENLKDMYDHQKTVVLPKARYDWLHLRLQDFKSVNDYNSAMFKITSQLKLCGENITDADMLEKTYSTFHANDVLLQAQYREKGFKKYSELISCLLVAEQNNKLLMKNHESRPTGSTPFPEMNATSHNKDVKFDINNNRGRGRGRGRGHDRGRGRGFGYGRNYGYGRGRAGYFKKTNLKWKRNDVDGDKKEETDTICYRCGDTGHWSRVCRTPKHLVELYQKSLEEKEKMEVNFIDGEGDFDNVGTTHLETDDFFANPEEKN